MNAKCIFFIVSILMLSPSSGFKIGRRSVSLSSCEDDRNESETGCKKEGTNIKIAHNSNPKQKATCIAVKAAQEARAASDAQLGAAENAALQVKMQLADKARAAAKAAEAALAGKQQIVEQLESEVREGEMVVQEEAGSLQTSQGNCNAAAQSAKQSGLQLKVLAEALKTAQANVANSEQAASGAQQELTEKQQLVDAAKKRVELLLQQLESARTDFQCTKRASERAAGAAQEAKQRATRERRMAEIRDKLHKNRIMLS